MRTRRTRFILTHGKKSQEEILRQRRHSPPASKKAKKKAEAVEEQPMDAMSQCVALCQEQKWREALLLCKRICSKAEEGGNADLYVGLAGAQTKIEYSLRRQMAGSLVTAAKQMLAKEYLLDVGE